MARTPWLTSTDIIEAVKRKISFPTYQNTFTDDDLLKFANEEVMIAMVPEVLSYHEEYFVYSQRIPLLANTLRYPIPNRAIGMRIRDIFYIDTNNNLFEMSRINADDKAYFQYNTGSAESPYRYFIEGNDIVLTPLVLNAPVGGLQFSYFLRPNQLVENENASIISNFSKDIICSNSDISPGDTLTINGVILTAVASSPSGLEFEIGLTSEITATNISTLINMNLEELGVTSSNNGTPASNIVIIISNDRNLTFVTSNSVGLNIPSTINLNGVDTAPANFISGTIVDLLQTKPGHRIISFDLELQESSANTLVLNESDVPSTTIVGDYVCLQNECIIPQLPPDLHISLVERVCARILSAIGDLQGLSAVNEKISQIQQAQSPLLGARVDGDAKKILSRKSLLRSSKYANIRRF